MRAHILLAGLTGVLAVITHEGAVHASDRAAPVERKIIRSPATHGPRGQDSPTYCDTSAGNDTNPYGVCAAALEMNVNGFGFGTARNGSKGSALY